mgnify:FL=1
MMIRFKDFIEENDNVIAQIRKVRDEMKVIRLKRDLEREKESLESLRKQKQSKGISTKYR